MARRGRKDRGLYEHPKGSDIWWICYFDHAGKRHREKIGPKGLARGVYEKRKTEIRERRYFPPERRRPVLFSEIAEDFLAYSDQAKKSSRMDHFRMDPLLVAFGGKPAEEITPEEIEEFKFGLAAKRSPATVNRYLALMKSTYNRALRSGKVNQNPVKGVSLYKENNIRVRYLSKGEEKRLITALPGYLRPLVTVAIHTGVREGELFSLEWRDVNLSSRILTVREAKSGMGRRVPLNSVAFGTIQRLGRERSRGRGSGNERVFRSLNGGFLHNLRRTWVSALKRAKIENLRFHDLRHTFASRLVMAGESLYTVQTLLGHKTPIMVQRYAHLSPEHLRQAVEVLAPKERRIRRTSRARKVRQANGEAESVSSAVGQL